MKKNRTRIIRTLISGTMLGLVVTASLSTVSQAETGSVCVVFAKAGFIVGVGAGNGILTFRGHNYPFRVSGMSLGATIGGSTNKMIGQALNLRRPAGTYSTIGAGGALAAGAGGV